MDTGGMDIPKNPLRFEFDSSSSPVLQCTFTPSIGSHVM